MNNFRGASLFRPTALLTTGLLIASMTAFGQDPQDPQQPAPAPPQQAEPATPPPQPPQPSTGGWRRVGDPANNQGPNMNAPNGGYQSNGGYPAQNGGYPQQGPPGGTGYPQQGPGYGYPQQGPGGQQQGPPPAYGQQPAYAPQPVPAQLTIKPGTYVTARVNQVLSSDRNQAGDFFSATLVRPIVVDGVVVAAPGQTIGGRVAEAQKAGRVSGVSRLGLELTDLTLVDGQQFPIKTQLVSRNGNTSVGRDVGAVAGTTALGAAVGAAADWGRGAAIGAGAGAAAGIVGVLLTRGQPTIVHPEQMLTFRIETPVAFSTERSQAAFHYVEPGEFGYDSQAPPPSRPGYAGSPYAGYAGGSVVYGGYPYYGYGYYYGPGYYPYYGIGFGFYGGHGFYGGRGWGGGFRGGRHR